MVKGMAPSPTPPAHDGHYDEKQDVIWLESQQIADIDSRRGVHNAADRDGNEYLDKSANQNGSIHTENTADDHSRNEKTLDIG